MLKFDSSQNYVKQDFLLPSPIIRYLMINANPYNLDALYRTCKYFYSKFKINIVYNLCLDSEELLTKNKPGPNDLKDVFLALNSKFTMNEWKILTHSGTIEDCDIYMPIYISENDDTEAPLEDILSRVLNAHSICFGNDCYTTKETMKKLMQLNFQQKLKEFTLWRISQILDANLMDQFLKKNLENKAYVAFNCNNENENYVFHSQMFEKINAWTPEERKPRTFPKFFIVQ